MGDRLELQSVLEDRISSANVYFQPPQSLKLKYPCVVYSRDRIEPTFANNKPYMLRTRYQVTYISKDPDDPTVEEIAKLPLCSHERFYTADNLNHDVFTLYF